MHLTELQEALTRYIIFYYNIKMATSMLVTDVGDGDMLPFLYYKLYSIIEYDAPSKSFLKFCQMHLKRSSGAGVAGRGRPSWDGGGRRTVKDDGRKIFFDSVRLKDGSGRRTD